MSRIAEVLRREWLLDGSFRWIPSPWHDRVFVCLDCKRYVELYHRCSDDAWILFKISEPEARRIVGESNEASR